VRGEYTLYQGELTLDRRRIIAGLTILSILLPITAQAAAPQSIPTKPVIVIDPGHGGADWGATDGIKEKDAVMAIGVQVAAILEAHGIKAILTRNGDYFIGLDRRVEIARESKADLFVSIHANYYDRPEAMGVETYSYGSGSRLAEVIQQSIVRRLAVVDRGSKTARYLVLRKSTIPAVLVETGFISNKLESAMLATPEYRNRMADAIARGILQYLGIEYKLVPARL
jgi:N-acetylmuramoyl-L-alanine amidase